MSAPVAEIAAEVLARTPESLRAQADQESFVGLGGSSMDAVRLLALCEQRLGLTLDLARLLDSDPLADVLAEATQCQAIPGPASQADQDRELLPTQRDMLQAEVLGAGSAMCLLASAELTGPLDEAALNETLAWITARHEALRTVFVQQGEQGFARRVLAGYQPQIIRQQLRIAPGDAGVQTVQETLGCAAAHLLAPLREPPVAFVLTRFGERHHLLSLIIHHLIADGWAISLLWREIFEHYQALQAGTVSSQEQALAPSPELMLRRQAALEASGRLEELTRARVAQLNGAPTVIELPARLPRTPTISFRSTQLAFGLSADARRACEDAARKAKVTRTVVILAAWALVVARRSGMAECLIGGTALQRPTAELMRTVSSSVAIIPIRCAFGDRQSTADYLRATSHSVSDAVASADVPFDELVARLDAAGDGRRVPLVQVMFSAQEEFTPSALEAGDLMVTLHEGHCHGTVTDAGLFVQRWDSEARLVIEYTSSVLAPEEVAELAAATEETLCEFARHYDAPLSRVRTAAGPPESGPGRPA
jgi:Condensation domain/Phosphopantetheine attachment site